MNTLQQIITRLRALPESSQREVLDFVEAPVGWVERSDTHPTGALKGEGMKGRR